MIDDLRIIHRREDGRAQSFEGLDPNLWVHWRTCLRHIAVGFMPEEPPRVQAGDHAYVGETAYQFFLEVVCGLHSPVLGETEIMGQFRELIEKSLPVDFLHGGLLKKFFSWVLADAKMIRDAHLRDLGSRSYGSLLRRHVKGCNAINFIGAGKLVCEILPWLHDKVGTVNIFCRRAEQGEKIARDFSKTRVHRLADFENKMTLQGAVIVAAPLEALQLETWLKGQPAVTQIIDLRHNAATDPLRAQVPVLKLHDLFREIKKQRGDGEAKVIQARKMATELTRKRFRGVEIHPFGWEDLCG